MRWQRKTGTEANAESWIARPDTLPKVRQSFPLAEEGLADLRQDGEGYAQKDTSLYWLTILSDAINAD